MKKIFEKDGIISADVFSTYRDGTQIGESVMIVIDSETGDIHDTKVSVVPFNQVSADHAFKEGEDNRSLNKWCEVHGGLLLKIMRPLVWISMKRETASWKNF